MGLGSAESVDRTRPERAFVLRHAVAQLLFWSAFYYLLPAVLPHLLAGTGWSDVAVSGAVSGGFLMWAILCPLAGTVVDQGRAGQAMRLAGLLGAGLLLIAAWSESIWIVCGALVLLGAPMAMTLYDPCFSVMLRRYGTEARRPITTVTLIAGFATLLTFPLVAGLVEAGLDWRRMLVIFAGLAVVAVIILPPDSGVPRSRHIRSEPAAMGNTPTIAIGVAFGLIMFGHAVLLFQLPAHLLETSGQSFALALPMILGPAQIAGRLAWEGVQGRFRLENAALGLFALILIPPLVLALGGGLMLAMVALVVQGACYGVHTILRPLLAAHWLPQIGIAQRLGVIAMIGLLMIAMAPAAGAWVAGAFGFGGLLGLVLIADLAGLATLARLVLRTRRRLIG